MKTINVINGFLLSEANSIAEFQPGVQEVEDWVADHWYTKVHCAPLSDSESPDDNEAKLDDPNDSGDTSAPRRGRRPKNP